MNSATNYKQLLKSLVSGNGFAFICARAVIAFAVIYGLFANVFVGTDLYYAYLEKLHGLASWFVTATGLEHRADWFKVFGELRTDTFAHIAIGEDSDGLFEMALFVAALLAWPASWLRKVLFTALGAVLIFVLAALRNGAALWTEHYLPLRYDLAVSWVFPSLLLLILLLFFLSYVRASDLD